MIELGAKLTGHAVIASENTYNGIHAVDEDSTAELNGGECNRNGFSFLGKDSKGTLSNLGGAGMVAEASARLVVTGMQISGNARDGINMSDCASETRVAGCTLTSNARNAILALCSLRPVVEITNNRCLGSERGIALDGTDFTPRLSGNHFGNLLVGVFMTPGARPDMSGSTFDNVRTEVQQAQP
jgi:nitrous oxidase accessory protein NosD